MKKKKHRMTDGQIDDRAAQDALRNSSQLGPMPTHSAMGNTEYDPDADASDAAPDDFGDFDDDRQGY